MDNNLVEAVQAAVVAAINTLGVTLVGKDFTLITSAHALSGVTAGQA